MRSWTKAFFLFPLMGFALPYEIRFIGLENREAIEALLEHSQLVTLQHRPPASINGLKYRIAADTPNLIKVLHSYAYYDAIITSNIELIGENAVRVDLTIHAGPQFSLKSYEVYSGKDCSELKPIENCCPFSPEQLGLKINEPALSVNIINAELHVLTELSRCGHPLAYIDKRSVEVDMADTSVIAASCVHEGPLTTFGPLTFYGIENINPRFIKRKLSWEEGSIYDSDLIAKTQERLLKTELFSSVLISHGSTLDEQGSLPLKMRITEAKHKKISLGAFYATVDGFGANAIWTHRNIRGMGEILSMKVELAQNFYEGAIIYKKPDFLIFDQTYRALFDVSREKIHPYHSFRYRLANYIDRPLPPHSFFSVGMKMDHIKVTDSATNGTYFLIGLPFFYKYDRADNTLDPRQGYTAFYSITPYQSLQEPNIHFVKQKITGTCYIPLLKNKNLCLAMRAQFGSIGGTKRDNVPLPKLFLGGSEDELRGYKYHTVSPLEGNKPLGGRSAFFGTAELRMRFFGKIGVVPFADFGTVSNRELPTFDTKWYKSLGLGLRYFAFFGPLRFDIGFPLDRRKGIDSNYQIYASVGQTF